MIEMGTYAGLCSSSAPFARLLEDINQHQYRKEEEVEVATSTKQRSRISSSSEEKKEKDDTESLPTNIEGKQEGAVKWGDYKSYLRNNVVVVIWYIFLMITVFSAQQAASIYSNWWLAQWANDETSRYRVYNNCTGGLDEKTNRIRLMSDIDWSEYRNQRFYAYVGKAFHK
jgi:hypothetical protein